MVPKPVLALGWAGAFPFMFLCLAAILGRGPVAQDAINMLLLYGAVILAFMGGAQWGLEMANAGCGLDDRPDHRFRRRPFDRGAKRLTRGPGKKTFTRRA
ncbi:DUF3429 domain-containing protein [Rhodoblastus acidophilus]|uniref:DUF3429 domain-containing protein n=1 Tax=Candidatus Rhodoblastus alkanivorans TaxID=2954117 RepID=A0ABS9Z850_9HYPH|nr:DUF3429 domain-containing protein [Candidatus Rhodoblastus alkanivorans]MCI4683616.1 DUF3429 domain-containing protein [Candidatus Rhodoblastus alkanivorans]MDI4640932.1 DUF3429 domain-containing protein [Rhodoblastus acidophilus]